MLDVLAHLDILPGIPEDVAGLVDDREKNDIGLGQVHGLGDVLHDFHGLIGPVHR